MQLFSRNDHIFQQNEGLSQERMWNDIQSKNSRETFQSSDSNEQENSRQRFQNNNSNKS